MMIGYCLWLAVGAVFGAGVVLFAHAIRDIMTAGKLSGKPVVYHDGWLSAKEIAGILGISREAVRKQCRKKYHGEFQKIVTAQGGEQYRIHIDSPMIPKNVRRSWYKQNRTGI